MHFTPPAVSSQIARLLAPHAGARVLDVGCGPGLFCIAGALGAPWAEFVGIEWRPRLVSIARLVGDHLGVANARFIAGDALELDWSDYDAFYLFNPFAEHLLESPFVIDRSVRLEPSQFARHVAIVQAKLANLPVGARVATYHGFGGALPDDYALATRREHGTDRIELWVKVR